MQLIVKLLAVTFVAQAAAGGPTPLDKVTELLEALRDDVKSEGEAADKEYKKVETKCGEEKEAKESTIELQKKTIDKSLGEVDVCETTLKTKNRQLAEYMQHQQDATKEKKQKKEECDMQIAEKTEHLRQRGIMLANIDKAEELLGSHASLIQTKKNPMEYEEHSGGIHDVLDKLGKQVRDSKEDEEDELKKQEDNCKKTDENLQEDLDNTKDNIENTQSEIAEENSKLAEAQGNLADARDLLRESTEYLEEVTVHCDNKKREHAQHEMLRAAEMKAMGDALDLLKGDVKSNDRNKRAALVVAKPSSVKIPASKPAQKVQSKAAVFLQTVMEHKEGTARAIAILQEKGTKIQSNLLVSLAHQLKLKDDPFKKVKSLIRDLIERLLEEARNESSKKGWCDNEMSKAEKSRDSGFASVMDLGALYGTLKNKEKQLEDLVTSLDGETGQIAMEKHTLEDETAERNAEKEQNEKDIDDSKKGLEALQDAMGILKDFYKKASKEKVDLIQTSSQGVDDPKAYKGKQDAASGIIGMLEVIESDFQRTIRSTQDSESTAAGDFHRFERAAKSNIAGMETELENAKDDLTRTKTKMDETLANCQTSMDLTDGAIDELIELNPTCVNTGMTYAERAEKRQQEIDALKEAIEALTP